MKGAMGRTPLRTRAVLALAVVLGGCGDVASPVRPGPIVPTPDPIVPRPDTLAPPGDSVVPLPDTIVPPPDTVVADVHVRPGDDLVAKVADAPPGSLIYLHPGPDGRHVYDIGAAVLHLPAQATIRGPEAERGPLGEVSAPVAIRGSGPQIFNQAPRRGWTIEHLDISGARWRADPIRDGTCVFGGEGTLRMVKIHDCDNRALGSWAGVLEYAELTNNSALRIPGHSAASKSRFRHTIRHAYVHGNHHTALWIDCDNAGWTVEDSRIVDNRGSGIFNEISRGPSVLRRNVVQGNNPFGVEGRGGLVITSSKDVTVEENVLVANGGADLRVWEDHRAGRGPAGCLTGYRTERVTLFATTVGYASGTDRPGVAPRGN